MKEKIKILLAILITAILSIGTTATALLVTRAENITLDSDKTDKTNVKEALDDIYAKVGDVTLLEDAYYKKEIPSISVSISSSHTVYNNVASRDYSSIGSSASITIDTNNVYVGQTGGGSLLDGVLSLSSSDGGSNRYAGTYTSSNSTVLNGGFTYVEASKLSEWNYPVLKISGSGAASSGNANGGKPAPYRGSSHSFVVNCGSPWKTLNIISNTGGSSITFNNGVLEVFDSKGTSGDVYSYSRSFSWSVELYP